MAWILAPTGSSAMTLTFTKFATKNLSDLVYVYTCSDLSCDISMQQGQFSGTDLPEPLISSTGVMKIVWRSTPSPTTSGWLANFVNRSSSCIVLNDPRCTLQSPCMLSCDTGSIGRFVFGGSYQSSEEMSWILAKHGASILTLSFTAFSTGRDSDYVSA